jgi:hypothetical protein
LEQSSQFHGTFMKFVVDLKDSLGEFQKPNENEDKQLLNAF